MTCAVDDHGNRHERTARHTCAKREVLRRLDPCTGRCGYGWVVGHLRSRLRRTVHTLQHPARLRRVPRKQRDTSGAAKPRSAFSGESYVAKVPQARRAADSDLGRLPDRRPRPGAGDAAAVARSRILPEAVSFAEPYRSDRREEMN